MKIKIYYDFESDILCIVDGKKIYKYIGTLNDSATQNIGLNFYKLNAWYKAKTHPEIWPSFKLIGEL